MISTSSSFLEWKLNKIIGYLSFSNSLEPCTQSQTDRRIDMIRLLGNNLFYFIYTYVRKSVIMLENFQKNDKTKRKKS
jgi:hypothetical protein